MTRVVVWFSCGAASAVAAKATLNKYGSENTVIAYAHIASEHPDNARFLKECAEWFNHEITILASEKYKDTWDVWERERYLVGPSGARCTTELKKMVRQKFQKLSDIQVFGYTSEESHRADRFRENNPEIILETPLIDLNLTKQDCLSLVQSAGIELPAMYRLGYANNNCIGCVKGGAGYWNKIRDDFPETFERMAKLERSIGATITKHKGERIYLDELPKDAGDYPSEPDISCSLFCHSVESEIKERK